MDSIFLRILVAAVEEKSLAKAGERENMVPSAISKRVSELERSVGITLLERHGRGVRPTQAGQMFYQRAKAILAQINSAKVELYSYSPDGAAQVRLAANASTVLQFLPRTVSQFARQRPELRIELIQALSQDIPRMVLEGKVDLGIYHAATPAAGLVSEQYAQDRVCLVVPQGHDLAIKDALYLEEALDYDFLGYFPRHSLEAFLELAEGTLSRPPSVKTQVLNCEARCAMVKEGLGIAIVPEAIAKRYATPMGLALPRINDAWAQRQMYICYRSADALPPLVADLLLYLRTGAVTES